VAATSRYRLAFFTVAFGIFAVVCTTAAPAALDLSIGDRKTVQNQSDSDCNARAQSALTSVLQRPDQINPGEWRALTPVTAPATPPQAASIHCYPNGNGYFATFECAVEIPPSQMSAADLCAKLGAAFDAKSSAYSGSTSAGGKK
jgi:hypothetical protein